jgi:hypothetical protein
MSDEFKQLVIKWLKLDETIKKEIIRLKEMKEEKKEYEELILGFMSKTNQDVLNISTGGALRKTISKTKGALKQEYITNTLTEYIKDKEQAFILTESIMNNRPINERQYLKRTLPRKSKE